MDLGTDLRQARERAGFSLPELSARTRIPLRSLLAIEDNEFEKVPPGIFLRSFIRAYAREVGIDPTAAIAEYRAMTDPIAEFPPEPQEVPDDEVESSSRNAFGVLLESRTGWSSALIVGALLVGVIAMNRHGATATNSPTSNGRDVTDLAAAATARPEPPVEIVNISQPVATTGTGLQMEIRAEGPCWVRAVVDGQPSFARLLQSGESQAFTAQRDVVLRVGDPAALSYTVNGRVGQPLGAANVPVTVRFDTDGRASQVS